MDAGGGGGEKGLFGTFLFHQTSSVFQAPQHNGERVFLN